MGFSTSNGGSAADTGGMAATAGRDSSGLIVRVSGSRAI